MSILQAIFHKPPLSANTNALSEKKGTTIDETSDARKHGQVKTGRVLVNLPEIR